MKPFPPVKSLLIANRGEIAIRVMRAATELGIRTVAIHSREDRFSLHRTKADESYCVGEGKGPIEAYLDIDDIVRIGREARVDAIHPGYGFLSESPEFAEACAAAGIIFVGPLPDTMRQLGNKVAARNLAQSAGVPVMPATPPLPEDEVRTLELAREVGFPVMLKASWGGGGRGMRIVEHERGLAEAVAAARREAKAAFGKDEVYLEKLIVRARHVEVQILGDAHGNLVHLYERDCSLQRRNQKVVERAPAVFLSDAARAELCEAALKIGRAVRYRAAGTVEFLQDADTGKFYFIEVNPRIQVEHTITECVTGVDLVKAQLRIAAGEKLGDIVPELPPINGHAIECRINAEHPEKFTPSPGKITAYNVPGGNGVRVDTAQYQEGVVPQYYDSLIAKLICHGKDRVEAMDKMQRALSQFVVQGIHTTIPLHQKIFADEEFRSGNFDTKFMERFLEREKHRV
jgi:pyruvate carboxylase